jgi:uncharacterized protein (TIGR02246 family)
MLETVMLPRRKAVLAAALGAMAFATPALARERKAGPAAEVDALQALLDSHDRAFSAHDIKGVLALFAPRATILGTGPGEIWSGPAEIKDAYEHFFSDFDAGKQQVEVLWHDGHVLGRMAWLMSVTKVTMTKGVATSEVGINVSVVFERSAGSWLIRAMHFSNLTGCPPPAGN